MEKEAFQLFTSIRYDKNLLEIPSSDSKYAGWNYRNTSTLYMLDFHRDRMLQAAEFWGWKNAINAISGETGLQRLSGYAESIVAAAGNEDIPQRIKLVLNEDGSFTHAISPVTPTNLANLFPARIPPPGIEDLPTQDGDPSKGHPFKVLVDDKSTNRSEFTHFKTTRRNMYDQARARARITATDAKEVLMVNAMDYSVMEGSVTTPYLWRNNRWVTPPVSNGFDRCLGSGGQKGTSRRWALERSLAVEEPIKVDSLVHGEECWLSNGVRGFVFGKIDLNPRE